MRIWKKAALLTMCLVVLCGCTKSSITNDVPIVDTGSAAPDKGEDSDDETLPRDQNILIEDETEEQSMYDWEQVKSETDDLFNKNSEYPQSEAMTFEADEDAMTVKLTWIVKDGTAPDEALRYASEMVRRFNDVVAVQDENLVNSTPESFGDLWKTFGLTVQVGTKDGKWLVDKTYKAGDSFDLVLPDVDTNGPQAEYFDGPNKDNGKK